MWFLEEDHESTVHHDLSISPGHAIEIFDLLLGLFLLLLIRPHDSLVVKAYNGDYKPFSGCAYHAHAETGSLSDRCHLIAIYTKSMQSNLILLLNW